MSRVVEYSVVTHHERNHENHSAGIRFAHGCGHPHRIWTTNSCMDMVSHGFLTGGEIIPSWDGAERYPGSLEIVGNVAVTIGVAVSS